MSIHDLERKTNLGGPFEAAQTYIARLDEALGKHYIVRTPEHALQNLGIDRVLVNKKTRVSVTAEYRVDSMAAITGQVFIEMEVVESGPAAEYRPGWLKNFASQVVMFVDLGNPKEGEGLAAIMVPALRLKGLATGDLPRAAIKVRREHRHGFSVDWTWLEAQSVGRIFI